MADKEMKGQSAAAVERREGKRKLFLCQYCDKAFTSSQALGGHQNGHRNEREVAKKAKHDLELYGLQNPFLSVPPTYLHHPRQSNICPPLYLPFHTMPAPNYYRPHHMANYLYNARKAAASHGQKFSSEHSFNGSSRDGAMLINEDHLKFLNWKKNYLLRLSASPDMGRKTAQASMAEPSSSADPNQKLQQDGKEIKDDKNKKDSEIDLTLRL